MREVTIGMLGLGNVGSGVWKTLQDMAQEIRKQHHVQLNVKKILVRNLQMDRGLDLPEGILTLVPEEVTDDPDITHVIECMGGEQPAAAYMEKALKNGKAVITANKMAIALNWRRLKGAAKEGKAGFYYEASVCGAIPIIRVLNDSMQANRIDTVMGIVNGTTNYILSKMTDERRPYEEVLKEAQELGLAEPDPRADVEGHDAAYKLSILSTLAFHESVPFESIFREGISKIQVQDITAGRDLGFVLKLLAIGKKENGVMDVRVHPAFVHENHPLAAVSGAFNAVYLHGSACGDMMLYGRGAGSLPTAGAMVSDLIASLGSPSFDTPDSALEAPGLPVVTDNWRCGFYLRFSALNQPGVLGHITTKLGENKVSISSIFQREAVDETGVPVIVITHRANEKDVQAALLTIDPKIAQVESVLRVEGK